MTKDSLIDSRKLLYIGTSTATNNIDELMNGNQTSNSILAVGLTGTISDPSGRLFNF